MKAPRRNGANRRDEKDAQGKVVIFTGDGKGKTTAAFGLVLRLAGAGRRVLVVQFAKSDAGSGEVRAVERFSPQVTVKSPGKGRLDLKASPRRAAEVAQVREAWFEALRLLEEERPDAVVFDELVFVVASGFLELKPVLDFLDGRPPALTVVMTGSGRVPELVERADYVTEMRKIKHPFDSGQGPVRGMEY